MERLHLLDVLSLDCMIIFGLEMLLLLRLFFIYTVQFKSHPVLTAMVSSSLLNALSDTIAQAITIVRERIRNMSREKEIRLDSISEEFDLPAHARKDMLKGAERSFDYERLARMVIYGFIFR